MCVCERWKFSRTSIIHFFLSSLSPVTVTQWWSMIKSSTYTSWVFKERKSIIKMSTSTWFIQLFVFLSFSHSRLMQSCVKISNTLISAVIPPRLRRRWWWGGGWNFTMRNERRRSLIDKEKVATYSYSLYVWKLKYQKFIKNVDFSIRKISIVHVSIVFIRFTSQTDKSIYDFFLCGNCKNYCLCGSWMGGLRFFRITKISRKINCSNRNCLYYFYTSILMKF